MIAIVSIESSTSEGVVRHVFRGLDFEAVKAKAHEFALHLECRDLLIRAYRDGAERVVEIKLRAPQ